MRAPRLQSAVLGGYLLSALYRLARTFHQRTSRDAAGLCHVASQQGGGEMFGLVLLIYFRSYDVGQNALGNAFGHFIPVFRREK